VPERLTPGASRFDDRDNLAFGHKVVEGNEQRLQDAGCRRCNGNFHLHGLDEGDVVAVADACAGLKGKRTHAAGNFGHNADIWHTNWLLVVAADCLR